MVKKTPNYLGKKFEEFVANIYFDLGKNNIKRNVRLYKRKKKIYSEFDIVYGILFKTYIECKYHSTISSKVSAQEVSFFAEKLRLHNIDTSSGIIVTNTYLSERSRFICKKNRITYIEREELQKLNYERMNLIDSVKYKFSQKKQSLEQIILS
jgi:hypothetical protein